jgi:Mg/Co/Ni transporter MgtE
MVSNGIHALPVVNDVNQLLGIVTTTDIMQAILHDIRGEPAPANAGVDLDGLAGSMPRLRERNALLEVLRKDVTRYLRGGQDEQLHTQLLRDIDQLGRQAELAMRL